MNDPLQPRLRILFGHAIPIGPGKAQLLEHIAETGSISAAARVHIHPEGMLHEYKHPPAVRRFR